MNRKEELLTRGSSLLSVYRGLPAIRSWALLRLGLPAVTAVICLSWLGQAAELLKNPGFEQGLVLQPGINLQVPENWTKNWRGTGTVEVVSDEQAARAGQKCVKVVDDRILQGHIPVVSGSKYLGRAWVKGTGTARIIVHEYDRGPDGKVRLYAGDWSPWKEWKVLPLTPQWQLYEIRYSPSAPDVQSICFAVYVQGTALVDDTSFREDDERPLSERLEQSPIEKEQEQYARLFAARSDLRKTFLSKFQGIYRQAASLKSRAREEGALEHASDLDREFDLMLEEYRELCEQVRFEEVLK